MMHMTFYWGKNVTLLFDFWRTSTWTDYSLTLVACLLISFFYQYLEHRRAQFNLLASSTASTPASDLNAPLLARPIKLGGWTLRLWKSSSAALFGINSAIGYMLMLAVMSFNGGVFVAVVLGLTIGHLVFRSAVVGARDGLVDNPCACA